MYPKCPVYKAVQLSPSLKRPCRVEAIPLFGIIMLHDFGDAGLLAVVAEDLTSPWGQNQTVFKHNQTGLWLAA